MTSPKFRKSLLCLSLAAACGTKGDLVLPPKDAPAESK